MDFVVDDTSSVLTAESGNGRLSPPAQPLEGVSSPTFTVTDLLTSLGERTQDPDYLVTKGNDLVRLLVKYPYIKADLVFSAFGHRLQTLLTHQKKEVVATGYRVCRYVINDVHSIRSLLALRLDVMIIISLSKGVTHHIEREHALKLVRQFIDTPDGINEITKGIANAILSVAEQQDDNLREICIETICEICLLRPDLVSPHCLLPFIIDGPFEMSSLAATVLMKLLNSPEGRSHIELSDILKLISPFTDFPVKGHINNEKLHNSATILAMFMKNLSGLNGFCMNNGEPMRELISCLKYPVNSVVSKLLDLFLDVLLMCPMGNKNATQKIVLIPFKLEQQFLLKTQYLSYLIVVFLNCGILDGLLTVLKSSFDEINQTKAGFLLTELFSLISNLVPDDILQPIIENFYQNGDYVDHLSKIVFTLEKLTRKSNKGRINLGLQNLKTLPKSTVGEKLNKTISENSKVHKNPAIIVVDDLRLKQMIMDSKVTMTKNFSKWNCEIISDLFKGAFMNGKRLEEVNKTTKFLKRLLSFFRPFKRKFSNTKRTKHSIRFVKLSCEIVESLLSTVEGRKLLSENKIVPQIAECLAQLDPYSGFYASDQIFSKERLATTLSYAYFKMLGVFSSDDNGIMMLQQWKIFTIMHHISDDCFKRPDVLILFMDEINFSKNGAHSKILLSKFLNSDNPKIKTHAINLMSKLITDVDLTNMNMFIIDLMADQLYHLDKEVILKIVKILNTYCKLSNENLNQIIRKNPSVDILRLCDNEECETLIMSFLSTDLGLEYLTKQGVIEQEFDAWTNGCKYINYFLDIEKLVLTGSNRSRDLPLNFFGQLVKTQEGFRLIIESGIMSEFVNAIRFYANTMDTDVGVDDHKEITDTDLLQLKAIMWSIGFISTSEHGIEALDIEGTVEDIARIVRHTPFVDIRNCGFHVLGLVSSTSEGIEILDELGWSTKLDVFHKSIFISLPRDIGDFIETWDLKGDHISGLDTEADLMNEIDFEGDSKLEKLFKIIGNLCNHVFLNSSSKELTMLSKSHPEFFEDPEIFYDVLRFMEVYRYRQTIRKMIIELFTTNGRMLETLVKRDRRRMKEIGK